MKLQQLILLFVALLLPIVIFVFLRTFGKNEFTVPPMFADTIPDLPEYCDGRKTLPYAIDAENLASLRIDIDSLACISFSSAEERLGRVKEEFANDPLAFHRVTESNDQKRHCIFLMNEPFDVALVDSKGRIRGQYNSSKRDEVDRMLTEIAIIFRKY
jgi:hypothetical protein